MIAFLKSICRHPIIVAFGAFAVASAILHHLPSSDEPLHCVDGRRSMSIGVRGACSHHGGVAYGSGSQWDLVALASIAIEVATYIVVLMLGSLFETSRPPKLRR